MEVGIFKQEVSMKGDDLALFQPPQATMKRGWSRSMSTSSPQWHIGQRCARMFLGTPRPNSLSSCTPTRIIWSRARFWPWTCCGLSTCPISSRIPSSWPWLSSQAFFPLDILSLGILCRNLFVLPWYDRCKISQLKITDSLFEAMALFADLILDILRVGTV